MDYLPGDTQMAQRLAQPEKAYVSRYALGRDYHKLVRKRVQFLADRIQQAIGPFGYRAEPSPRLWLCCDLLHQQELSEADDTADFAPPAGIDLSQLQAMIASGMATTQVKLTFDEQRLGMMLADAADGSRTVVRRDAARGGWGRPEVVGAMLPV